MFFFNCSFLNFTEIWVLYLKYWKVISWIAPCGAWIVLTHIKRRFNSWSDSENSWQSQFMTTVLSIHFFNPVYTRVIALHKQRSDINSWRNLRYTLRCDILLRNAICCWYNEKGIYIISQWSKEELYRIWTEWKYIARVGASISPKRFASKPYASQYKYVEISRKDVVWWKRKSRGLLL